MDPRVDVYLIDGCGRCQYGGTPLCKVHRWSAELELLRTIAIGSGLTEELKWGVPCYTFQKKNIALIAAFKENCTVSFFKGALLTDHQGFLEKPGEHTQASRLIRFTSVDQIVTLETVLKAYFQEAIHIEKQGLKVEPKKTSELIVSKEFQQKLDEIQILKKAFEALTPGRQRAYILYFSQPKLPQTRRSRVEKMIQQILNGKGLGE